MATPVYIGKKQNDNPRLFHLRMRDFVSQNREDGWIEIMDYCYEQVPYLMKGGKPSDDEIQQSLVGVLGFKSWRDFLDDIGWSLNTWKYWRKAYAVVLNHKYLRNVQPKKSQIHNVKRKFKEDFPNDHQEWQSAVASLKGNKTTTKGNQLDVLRSDTRQLSYDDNVKTNVFKFKSFECEHMDTQKVKDLEVQLAQAESNNQKLQVELSSKAQENEILVIEIEVLRQGNIELENELDESKKDINLLGVWALGILFFMMAIFLAAAEFGAFA